MTRKTQHSNFILLNLGVLFISTSGVLGRAIDLPVPITIGARALLAGLVLLIFLRSQGSIERVVPKDRKIILAAGLLMGAHWITYFYALQLSSVAIGMLSLYTFPIITAFLEPLFFKTNILRRHIWLGSMVLAGIYFLVPDFNFDNNYFIAVLLGILSAGLYAVRNIMMKLLITSYDESHLMVYQLSVTAIVLLPFLLTGPVETTFEFLPHLLILAIVTTAIGHTLFLYGFRNFSAASASILSCLQPIYGILLGVLFLGEFPQPITLLGGAMILAAVLLESLRMLTPAKNK